MKSLAIAGILITITCFSLSFLIFISGSRSRLSNLMLWFNVFVGLWGLGAGMAAVAQTANFALWGWRLANLGGFPLGITFYQIAYEMTGQTRQPSPRIAWLFGLVACLFIVFGLIVTDTQWLFGMHYHQGNWLYVVSTVIWSAFVILGHRWLFLAYRHSEGMERRQFKFVFYSMAIGFIGGMSVLLPALGVPIYPAGNLSIPIYAMLVTYAVVRHRLLDIVIRKSLMYSALVACITASYLLMILIMERWFAGFFGYRSLVATTVVAGLIAIGFNPLRDRIQSLIDRALFSGTPPELAAQREQLLGEVRKGEQLKAVATLAAGLAHEVKNPLASIKTFTEHLETHFDDPGFRAKFTKIVGGEVERINLIVQQLLEFAKPVPPKLQPINMAQVVDETLEFLNNELTSRQVEVRRQYGPVNQVLADPQQLRQVFLNLFLNSLDAMNGHGGQLTLTTRQDGAELVCTLTDTGTGIAPEHLAHLGEPFYTTKPTGTGLGLAVVQGIVKEHGGRMAISSTPGQGTSVSLVLPLQQ